jgi:HipA-like protein
MALALEHVRRMRGGSQPHLMRCDDSGYYIVKFMNNPQHRRILANEMLATRLAARLGFSVPQVEVIEVRSELIAYTSELVVQLGTGRMLCSAGKQLGSRYPGNPAEVPVHDVLPGELMNKVGNLADFLGIFVFDKWSCNTDRRQVIFFRDLDRKSSDLYCSVEPCGYTAMMIDQGACFNGGEWNFPDAPLHGIAQYAHVYDSVAGMDSFEPWIGHLERLITEDVLREEALRIPSDWIGDEYAELERLLERMYTRRMRLRELIGATHKSNRNPFPNWKKLFYCTTA